MREEAKKRKKKKTTTLEDDEIDGERGVRRSGKSPR